MLIGDSEGMCKPRATPGLSPQRNYGFGAHDRAAHPRIFISIASPTSFPFLGMAPERDLAIG